MLIIENRIIEKEEKSVRYTLNYPVIKLLNKENNFIFSNSIRRSKSIF